MSRYADHRAHLQALIQAALRAADPAEAVRRHWNPDDLGEAERIFLVGAGKGGLAMARAAAELLGPRLTRGVIAVPIAPPTLLQPVEFIQAGHPQPNAGSLQAGAAITQLLGETTERDLVLALFSGGGSALMEQPVPGVGLEQLQALTTALMRAGANINELNCVRKHLSRLKGGGLARLAAPSRLMALILSDVIGDPLEVIASGPTVPDPTTVLAAREIIRKYLSQDPTGSADKFGDNLSGLLSETPKPGDPIFSCVNNRLIGSNRLAREAAAEAARTLGFTVHLPDLTLEGEAREWGPRLSTLIAEGPAETAWIMGGETTVTVRGSGVGGRNHEVALAVALALDGSPPQFALASFGTDGIDGPSPAAGAIVTTETCARARALGLDPEVCLANNDSYPFFHALGDCIVTGPTGTNVNDVVVLLRY